MVSNSYVYKSSFYFTSVKKKPTISKAFLMHHLVILNRELPVLWTSSERLTGSLKKGGSVAFFPNLFSWYWISWITSWARPSLVGGSVWTCYKKDIYTSIIRNYKNRMNYILIQVFVDGFIDLLARKYTDQSKYFEHTKQMLRYSKVCLGVSF